MGRRERNSKPPRGTEARARGGWGSYLRTTEATVVTSGAGGSGDSREHINKYSSLALEHQRLDKIALRWAVILLSFTVLKFGFAGAFLYYGYLLHVHLSNNSPDINEASAVFLAIGLQLYVVSLVGGFIANKYRSRQHAADSVGNMVKFERIVKGG